MVSHGDLTFEILHVNLTHLRELEREFALRVLLEGAACGRLLFLGSVRWRIPVLGTRVRRVGILSRRLTGLLRRHFATAGRMISLREFQAIGDS